MPTPPTASRHDDPNPVEQASALIDALRPRRGEDTARIRTAVTAMIDRLGRDAAWRARCRAAVLGVLVTHRHVPLLADTGVLPNTGFFTECTRRVTRSILPGTKDNLTLRDVFSEIFDRPGDAVWLGEIGAESGAALLDALRFDEHEDREALRVATDHCVDQLLESLRVISYHISGLGLEEEMLRLDPALGKFASPFLAQNVEALAYLDAYARWHADPTQPQHDEKHWLVLLDQCRKVADGIRKRAARSGTSFSLTFLLVRLEQNIARAERLLGLLDLYHRRRGQPELSGEMIPLVATLLSDLAGEECRKNDLGDYLRQTVRLMSLRITENAGRTGEHYITESRAEWFDMLKAGMGAGFIIAFMALLKIFLTSPGMPPVNQIIVYGLDYGLGFVLIHMLRFTVATKQPAMTANAIAAAIPQGRVKARELEALVKLVRRTARSQFAAVAGNVLLVLPTSVLLILVVRALAGHDFIPPEKVDYLLHTSHPWHTATVFYAAIAGVFLFLAGILAGFCDNLCAYNRLPERIPQAKWLVRLIGRDRTEAVARYVGENFGALVGNFTFGFMLAGGWGFGMLFGLPIDIRHITFSSANIAFGATMKDFSVAPGIWIPAALGVVLIGAINLAVSFSLALFVALRSRGVTLDVPNLLRLVAADFLRRPFLYFIPHKVKLQDDLAPEGESATGPEKNAK